ncbi:unnamed protein product [Cladocopium goreaui]|uniref:EF-hand domain-containing protein n=1 Tax=Cladocopium goreaui TaxID=2562237 RepID=A0A9P1GAV9_9DINO|nr:unnamed protein product [Cladocopium goreaui]
MNVPVEEAGIIPELAHYLKCKGGKVGEGRAHRNWIDTKCGRFVSNTALWLNVALFIVVANLHEADWQSLQIDPVLQGCYCGGQLLLLAFFSYELWQRLKSADEGIDAFMKTGWNCYDAFLIALGFVDACVLNFIPVAQVQAVHNMVLLLAPALQILRLGRVVTELRLIILGIVKAMRAVFWAMVLLTLVIYFFAVFTVHYVGEMFRNDVLTSNLSSSMGEAMFTLFSFATLEDYTTTVRHFMRSGMSGVLVAVCIVGFILFANLALLNLLTAIMVEAVVDILPLFLEERSEVLNRETAARVKKLKELFHKMEEHGSKRVSCDEFQKNVDQHVKDELGKLQIANSDLNELFKLIDFTGAGALSQAEFIDGLMRMTPAPASKRELLEVQHDLHRMWNMLSVGQERLQEQLTSFMKDLPVRLLPIVEEVREMRDTYKTSLVERDKLAQTLAQQVEATCSRLPIREVQASECEIRHQLNEVQQSLADLTDSRNGISEQLVHLLEEVQGQHSMMLATSQTQQSLSARFDELEAELQVPQDPQSHCMQGHAEEKKTIEPEVTKMFASQETQTVPSENRSRANREAFDISSQARRSWLFPAQHSLANWQTLVGCQDVPGNIIVRLRSICAYELAKQPAKQFAKYPKLFQLPIQSLADMQWSYPDLSGSPSPYTDGKVRVAKVLRWLQNKHWMHLPFDKLILRLEGAGIQLSMVEQDILKCYLADESL